MNCRIWVFFCFLTGLGLGQTNFYSACLDTINNSIREYTISTSASYYNNEVFDRYCNADGSSKTSNLGASLDVIVESIPIVASLTGSSSQEKFAMFCRDYASQVTEVANSELFQSKIVERAYETFDKCILLAGAGIQLNHTVKGLNAVDFFIAPADDSTLTIQGVETSSESVECLAKPPGGETTIDLDYNQEGKGIILNQDESLNIICRRESKKVDGNYVYEEDYVTILTGSNLVANYTVYLPAETQYPENRASVLNLDNARLTLQNQDLSDRLYNAEYRLSQFSTVSVPFYTAENSGWASSGFRGQWFTPSTNINSAGQQMCGIQGNYSLHHITQTRDQPGGCCGGQQWVATCVLFPEPPSQ